MDLVPFDSEMTIFEDETGSQTVAPIRLDGEDYALADK